MVSKRTHSWIVIGLLSVVVGYLYLGLGWRPTRSSPTKILRPHFLKEYEFTADMFSSRIPLWKKLLEEFKGKPSLQYLEVGVYEGASFLWMLENILTHPSARATAVDIFTGNLEQRFRANINRSGVGPKVKVLKGFSQLQLRPLAVEGFDIIYIDGSHLAKHVLLDAALSWDLLKENGLLIFDDYLTNNHLPLDLRAQISIDAFLTAFGGELELVHKGLQVALRKKKNACRREYCSVIGQYAYDWGKKELLELQSEEVVSLSLTERLALERMLRSYVEVRHSEADFVKFTREDKDFLGLQQKLNIKF